jgi:hypothetical protein
MVETTGWKKNQAGEWELKVGGYIVRIEKVEGHCNRYHVRLYREGEDMALRFVDETRLLSEAMKAGEASLNFLGKMS